MPKKILFINPKIDDKSIVFAVDMLNPVSMCLPYMATMALEEGFEVKIIDENHQEIDYERETKNVDLISITTEFFAASRVRRLSRQLGQMGKPIIIDGLYPTFVSEDAIKYGDSIIIGEPEHIWRKVLRDLKKGDIQKVYKVDGFMDLKDLPIYDKEILPPHEYLFPVEATRGCRFRCGFCLETKFYDFTVRTRPVADVIKQIESSGERHIHFMNCDIVADHAYAKELFLALKPLNILWGSQSTITIAQDDELLKLAAESGCILLFFGFESVNNDSMREANKSWSNPLNYVHLIKKVHNAGIGITASFVFGFDHDGKDVFEKTLTFVEDNKLEIAHFVPLGPIAGTEFHKKFGSEDRMSYLDEGRFDHYHASFEPKLMTKKELEEGLKYLWKNCYSKKGIHKRLSNYTQKYRETDGRTKPFTNEMKRIVYALNLSYQNEVEKSYGT
ncbi:MAG: B12-binding domain-containing radical SAM protein [Promethearchaeota archaeon]|jgi:radical SAM superfamily enzyme YgiQ (UPF0313 family)